MGDKIKKRIINTLVIVGVVGCIGLGGLILNEDFRYTLNSKLIYEEEVSPNKDYVTSKSQIILYNIKIYQKKNKNIIIRATSNSEMFEDMKFGVEHNKEISSEDVKITWGTLMGDQNFAKDNNMIQAKIEFLANGQVFHEEIVNYASNLFKIIENTMK